MKQTIKIYDSEFLEGQVPFMGTTVINAFNDLMNKVMVHSKKEGLTKEQALVLFYNVIKNLGDNSERFFKEKLGFRRFKDEDTTNPYYKKTTENK